MYYMCNVMSVSYSESGEQQFALCIAKGRNSY